MYRYGVRDSRQRASRRKRRKPAQPKVSNPNLREDQLRRPGRKRRVPQISKGNQGWLPKRPQLEQDQQDRRDIRNLHQSRRQVQVVRVAEEGRPPPRKAKARGRSRRLPHHHG